MKIYIAGRFDDKLRLRLHGTQLTSFGHTIVSSWLNESVKPLDIPTEAFLRGIAVTDVVEVKTAECFILDTAYSVGERGGRENEFGLIMDKPFVLKIVVGPRRTCFHRLADLHFETWDELLRWFPTVADNTKECLEQVNFGKEGK